MIELIFSNLLVVIVYINFLINISIFLHKYINEKIELKKIGEYIENLCILLEKLKIPYSCNLSLQNINSYDNIDYNLSKISDVGISNIGLLNVILQLLGLEMKFENNYHLMSILWRIKEPVKTSNVKEYGILFSIPDNNDCLKGHVAIVLSNNRLIHSYYNENTNNDNKSLKLPGCVIDKNWNFSHYNFKEVNYVDGYYDWYIPLKEWWSFFKENQLLQLNKNIYNQIKFKNLII